MAWQPQHEPLETSEFFTNGQAARPLPANTLPQEAPVDPVLTSGMAGDEPVAQIPLPVTAELLAQGQKEYDIYCIPCHGLLGDGNGMVVQRGFPQPPSFHSERLRQMPDGAIFDIISNGFGVMYAYGSRVEPMDRWAIVAYVRALQLSQQAAVSELPPADQQQLQEVENQP